MCGLYGVISRELYPMDLDFFKDLMYISAFRGRDSAGVAGIRVGRNKIVLHKHDVEPAEFLATYGGKNGYLSDPTFDIMMGHSRWATMGAVTDENAHPFETSKYVGAHNGTLVDKRFRHATKTDSQLLFEEMDSRGIVETLSDLSPVSAWAVSIYDKVTKKLWLGRNSRRPLYIGFLKTAPVMFWASELEMLNFVSKREQRGDLTMFTLEADFLYEIDLDKIKRGNHSPWIRHKIERQVTADTTEDVWANYMANSYGDIENHYEFDHDLKAYVIRKKEAKRSRVSELLDELEEDVETSRRESKLLI